MSRLKDLIAELHPDRVVGLAERRQALPVYDLLDPRFCGIRIEEVANLYKSVLKLVCINELLSAQLIFSSEPGARPRNLKLQSMYSYAIATGRDCSELAGDVAGGGH